MNKYAQKAEPLQEETSIKETQDQPSDALPHNSKSKPKKQRPKRGGCGGLAGDAVTSLPGDVLTPLETEFLAKSLAGDAATFLTGSPGTTLTGNATVSLLPGTPGTSLLVLAKENIQKGTIIKKTDLEGYVLPQLVNIPDKVIRLEDLVGKDAQVDIPAKGLLGAVVLTGNPSIPVNEINIISDRALVLRTKKTIRRNEVINREDLEVYFISKAVSNPDMYDNADELVGKRATENIPENKILKKYMVKA